MNQLGRYWQLLRYVCVLRYDDDDCVVIDNAPVHKRGCNRYKVAFSVLTLDIINRRAKL